MRLRTHVHVFGGYIRWLNSCPIDRDRFNLHGRCERPRVDVLVACETKGGAEI